MIKKIIAFIFALFLAWCVLSYVDIVTDNNTDHPVHSNYNIIVLLNEYSKEARR